MKQSFAHAVILIALVIAISIPAAAQLISHVELPGGTVLSPDGDGLLDSLIVRVTLSDAALGASAFIYTAASPRTIVDTLFHDAAMIAGDHVFPWHGTDMHGDVVPDGRYDLLLRAFNAAYDDSVWRTVSVDVTSPSIMITSLVPGIYAPDIDTLHHALVAGFSVSDSPPEDADQLKIFIYGPTGTKLATLAPEEPFAGNGVYEVRWDGTGITADGWHKIEIIVTDSGGHSGSEWSGINVDKNEPAIHMTGLESGVKLRAVPDSLAGWAWDRNGLRTDSLVVKYSGILFVPVASKYYGGDTLHFSIPLADSLTGEGQHVLLFKARDVVGRRTQVSFRLTLDTTAPAPPILAQPAVRAVRAPVFTLTGTAPGEPSVVRIFRNGSLIDSIAPLLSEDVSHEVPLLSGSNVFTASSIDEAGNTSAVSNAVEMVFDASPGLFMPQPFRPDEAFQINLAREARSIELRLYDMSGDLIRVIEQSASATSVTVPWNGLNGDGEPVDRGPVVVVARIEYASGGMETIREIVLLKP